MHLRPSLYLIYCITHHPAYSITCVVCRRCNATAYKYDPGPAPFCALLHLSAINIIQYTKLNLLFASPSFFFGMVAFLVLLNSTIYYYEFSDFFEVFSLRPFPVQQTMCTELATVRVYACFILLGIICNWGPIGYHKKNSF